MAAQLSPAASADVFLNPGDLIFHSPSPGVPQPVRLHTLLGSCVSVILWHPERRLVGMSHTVLPGSGKRGSSYELDGRYCDQAVEFFCREIARVGAYPQQFKVFLVGGGRINLALRDGLSIGDRNVEAVRSSLKKAGFLICAEHVGLDAHRKVSIDLMSGTVTVIYDNRHICLSTA